jgi:hypothetical protein
MCIFHKGKEKQEIRKNVEIDRAYTSSNLLGETLGLVLAGERAVGV